MKNIKQAVNGSNLAEPKMPLIHSTSMLNCRGVINDNCINTIDCDVFNEKLLYFFYGKPSYRVYSKSKSRNDIACYPVSFIMDPAFDIQIKRIFPFDSGAFHNGFYKSFVSELLPVESFELGTGMDVPQKIIDLFFGNNKSYYFGEIKSGVKFGPLDFELNLYHQLISSTGESSVDDRRSSIELQVDRKIELNKNNIMAVVLPKSAMDDPDVLDVLNKWEAEPITYNTYAGTAPIEYHIIIREYLGIFFKSKKII